jgi:hypothetical protein
MSHKMSHVLWSADAICDHFCANLPYVRQSYLGTEHESFHPPTTPQILTEFSFGRHFPEITQPLDNSFEVTYNNV